jgi:hypothetical protein
MAWSTRIGLLGIALLTVAGGCGTTSTQSPATSSAAAPPSGAGGVALDCKRGDSFGPIAVSPAQYLARTGAGATRFSSLATNKQLPLEECGIRGVLKRLVALKCNDGSNPFDGDLNTAHRSRAGNLGPGGRCGSIIDEYGVPCPEATYQVFADSYVCPEGALGWP